MTTEEQARFGIDKPVSPAPRTEAEPARPNFPPRLEIAPDCKVAHWDVYTSPCVFGAPA